MRECPLRRDVLPRRDRQMCVTHAERPMGGAFPPADRQPRDAAAGAVVSLWSSRMTVQRMDHVGIVVDDLAAATAFFVELGLKVLGERPVEGGWVDRVVGSRASAWTSRCWRPWTAMDGSS